MISENEITKFYNTEAFFERVKTLVKQNSDLNLRDFLESCDIKPESYYTLRKMNNFPRCNDGQRIADALGVSLDYLVTGEIKDSGVFPYEDEYKIICEGLLGLEEDQRDMLIHMIKAQIKYFQDKNAKK